MTIPTWKKKYYIPVHKCRLGYEAAASLKKWTGVSWRSLLKHQVAKEGHILKDLNNNIFSLDSTTCHLCFRYNEDCYKCTGFYANGYICEGPYLCATDEDNLEPMLLWLRTAAKYECKNRNKK